MDRRKFLKTSVLGAATAAFAPRAFAAPETETIKPKVPSSGYVQEPSRNIPIIASADVVVVGGGPAGFSAAVGAARQGADVLLLEKCYYLGGLWTGGLVLPVIDTIGRAENGQIVNTMGGIGREVCDKLLDMGMCIYRGKTPVTDPEATKYMLEQIIAESGARLLYGVYVTNVIMSGDRISTLIVESKSGRCAIKAKIVVDCSGDGDVIEFAGESFEHRKHHIGAMWRVGGVNPNLSETGPGYGVVNRHLNGENDQDGLDIFNLTRLQLKYRKYMWDDAQSLRKNSGYENAFLLDTPSQLGVRITRVLNSVHNVTVEEYKNYGKYEDTIGLGGRDGGQGPLWQIPYRALIPKRCPNLIVGGRCFGFEEGVTYDAREIGTCLVTGQAAGVAAAMASSARTSVQTLDIPSLQKALKAQKVILQ